MADDSGPNPVSQPSLRDVDATVANFQLSLKEFKPLHNVCEFLNALHVYADEARRGVTRFVEANHYCSHVSKDLRQCLIYDSSGPDAKLIGVEYMVPRHVYDILDPEEQKLWHSHEFEVKSGMLVLPQPSGASTEEWEKAEVEAMKEVVGLYGKTWHFWQVDRGDPLPLGNLFLNAALGSISLFANPVFRHPKVDGLGHELGAA